MSNTSRHGILLRLHLIPAVLLTLLLSSSCSKSLPLPSVAAHWPQCRVNGDLPDPACTPGAVDPRVTQSNLVSTICAVGYTLTVRPPGSYTRALKRRQIAEYGYADTSLPLYEEDHLIPLSLGGAPFDPHNLWPEPGRSPNPKDAVERKLHRLVCAGKMSLAEAQTRMRTNWKTAAE